MLSFDSVPRLYYLTLVHSPLTHQKARPIQSTTLRAPYSMEGEIEAQEEIGPVVVANYAEVGAEEFGKFTGQIASRVRACRTA